MVFSCHFYTHLSSSHIDSALGNVAVMNIVKRIKNETTCLSDHWPITVTYGLSGTSRNQENQEKLSVLTFIYTY